MAARLKIEKKNTFKRHLLLGQWPDFKLISQKCSLGDTLPKLLKWLRLLNKMATKAKNRKPFKRHLLLGKWPDFKIISKKYSLGDCYNGSSPLNQMATRAHLSSGERSRAIMALLLFIWVSSLYTNINDLQFKVNTINTSCHSLLSYKKLSWFIHVYIIFPSPAELPFYRMYSDRQTWANSVDPDETPQNAASHQGLLCLPIIQQFLDTVSDSTLYLFKF